MGETVIDADHPAVLVGTDQGPTPAELLLNAPASCLMAGLGNVAAARGVELRGVRCTVEGDIDLRGILGIDADVRNGFQDIRVVFEVDGDGDAETLESLVRQSQARSAVFDVLTHGTAVTVQVVHKPDRPDDDRHHGGARGTSHESVVRATSSDDVAAGQ